MELYIDEGGEERERERKRKREREKIKWEAAEKIELHVYHSTLHNISIDIHGTKEVFNLPPLVLKARHLSGSAFCWIDTGLP